MSDQNPVLYKNWLKAGLGLLYTKHGIQKIVEDVIAGFHRKTYGNIGSHCKTCSTQNVLSCPTTGICGRRCNFHDNTDPQRQPINCPVNVCQYIRDEIIREHRYSLPSFKNTRAEQWYDNSWEIAKCYMAATGYHDVQSADDTDLTGLVSVILNLEPFQHEVNADLTLKGNIFEKARDSRNSIMHNANMEVPTSDLPNHFLTLKSILSDGKRIQLSPEAQAALQKINDLENDLITITADDEMKIREESLRSIENLRDKSLKELDRKKIEGRDILEQKLKEGRETLEQKTTEGRDTLEQKTTEGKDTLEQKTTEGKHILEQTTTESKDTLEQTTTEGKDALEKKTREITETLEQKTKDITKTLEQKTRDITDTLEQKTTEGKETLEQKTREGTETLEQKTREGKDTLEKKTREAIQQGLDDLNVMAEKSTEKLHKRQAELDKRDSGAVDQGYGEQKLAGHLDREYLEKKKNLQRELIEFYLSSGVNSSPIPVLFDDEDFEVDDLFIMPQIMIAEHEGDGEDIGKINTISELFKNTREKGRFVRRLCIKGEAGYGKTFLCKKIVSSWCKIHSGKEPDKLADTDITFLKSFDLLFYLPLRNSQATTISELIKQLVVREGLHYTLHEILKRESEKCLIILDGLDEYSAVVGIPESDQREKYSIILTSRPWKIESLRPTQHSLGQEIQLTSIENSDTLIEAVVDLLNKKYGGQKNWTEFKYATWNENFLEGEKKQHLAEIPVILIQMICMWYDGENIGDKKTDLYKEMLVYLFKLGEQRRPEISPLIKEQTTSPKLETKENKHFFQDMERLLGHKRVASIIFKLAELAFRAIFDNKREDMLIFSHSDMEIYTLSKADVHICLSIGFLSHEKMHRKVTKREKVLSFIHKTFQEFFAALHIANGNNTVFKDMLQSLRSLDDIMEQRELFMFMVGFKPGLLSELSKHIAEIVDSDQRILCYRNPAYHTNDGSFPNGYTHDVQEIILICIDECGESGADYKVELRDVIVYGEESEMRIKNLIPRLNCENIKSLRAYLFIGDLLKKINMKHIVKLELVVGSQEEIDLLARMMGRSVQNLASFTLGGRSRSTACIKNVLDELVNANQLTNLGISDFNLSHDEILYMCNMFSQWRQLEVISLGTIMCQTCKAGRCEYIINLSDNVRLRDVSLFHIAGDVLFGGNFPIERIYIRSLKHGNIVVQQLKDLKTLEELSVYDDTFTYMEKRETDKIEISTTAPPPASDIQVPTISLVSTAITEVIPTLHNLKRLVLFDVDLEDDNLSVSCQTQGLDITLAYGTMTLKCLKTLVESILQSPCKIKVCMFGVYIKPKQDTDAAIHFIRDSCNVVPDDGMPDDKGIVISFTNK